MRILSLHLQACVAWFYFCWLFCLFSEAGTLRREPKYCIGGSARQPHKHKHVMGFSVGQLEPGCVTSGNVVLNYMQLYMPTGGIQQVVKGPVFVLCESSVQTN